MPQSWLDGVEGYRNLLEDVAAQLDRPGARVVVAAADAGYDRAADAFDDTHPNARGELRIAAAIADALHQVGVGPAASRPLPEVPVGPAVPPVLSATALEHAVWLPWVPAPGAATSEVWLRDLTAGGEWARLAAFADGTTYTATLLPAGHRLSFQTRPRKGNVVAEPPAGWSDVVTVVVPADPVPPPPTLVSALRAVRHETAVAKPHGRVRTSGRRVAGARSYTLLAATVRRCRTTPPPAARFSPTVSRLPGAPCTRTRVRCGCAGSRCATALRGRWRPARAPVSRPVGRWVAPVSAPSARGSRGPGSGRSGDARSPGRRGGRDGRWRR